MEMNKSRRIVFLGDYVLGEGASEKEAWQDATVCRGRVDVSEAKCKQYDSESYRLKRGDNLRNV